MKIEKLKCTFTPLEDLLTANDSSKANRDYILRMRKVDLKKNQNLTLRIPSLFKLFFLIRF